MRNTEEAIGKMRNQPAARMPYDHDFGTDIRVGCVSRLRDASR
jgi:hypothetical protein